MRAFSYESADMLHPSFLFPSLPPSVATDRTWHFLHTTELNAAIFTQGGYPKLLNFLEQSDD